MRLLGIGMRQGQVMVGAGLVRVKGEIELILPAKLKAGLGQRVVAQLGAGVPLGQVCRMGSQLVGHHALTHVFLIRQAQVFLAGHIAEHGAASLGNDGTTQRPGDVVITGGNIGGQRPEGSNPSLSLLKPRKLNTYGVFRYTFVKKKPAHG